MSTEPQNRLNRVFINDFKSDLNRSGFNRSIDRYVDPNSPDRGLKNGIIDPNRNSLLKLGVTNNRYFGNKKISHSKKMKEKQLLLDQFDRVYKISKDFKLRQYANKSI